MCWHAPHPDPAGRAPSTQTPSDQHPEPFRSCVAIPVLRSDAREAGRQCLARRGGLRPLARSAAPRPTRATASATRPPAAPAPVTARPPSLKAPVDAGTLADANAAASPATADRPVGLVGCGLWRRLVE